MNGKLKEKCGRRDEIVVTILTAILMMVGAFILLNGGVQAVRLDAEYYGETEIMDIDAKEYAKLVAEGKDE